MMTRQEIESMSTRDWIIVYSVLAVLVAFGMAFFIWLDTYVDAKEERAWRQFAIANECKPQPMRYGFRTQTWTCKNGDSYGRTIKE